MARYLGRNAVLKSPRTARSYTIVGAARWDTFEGDLRPPAHIIGVGGFGVTYRAVDELGAVFAMKEYFPRDHAQRNANGVIVPKRSENGLNARIYEEGLRRFIAEGHLLTSFDHPNLCRVVDAFDANGTSYQLMKLVEGREILGESDTGAARIERRVTLEDYFRELERPDSGAPLDLALFEPVFRQLLDAVEYVHTEGSRKAKEITGTATRMLLHRDIKPANILILAPNDLIDASAAEVFRSVETRALLIDFGSARMFRDAAVDDVSRSIGVVTEGYAPPELKDNDLEQQGPHSDIYSLAAVVWRAFTGRKPTSAQLANGAKLTELALPVRDASGAERPRAGRRFLVAIDRALNAGVSARPQSIAAWRTELFGPEPKAAKAKVGTKGKGLSWGWPLALLLIMAVVYLMLAFSNPEMLVFSNPEGNIREQAMLAFDDASRLSGLARLTADEAAAAALVGLVEAKMGVAKANEADAKYQRFLESQTPRRIYHRDISGDPAYGDRSGNFSNLATAFWCHRKSDNVIPDRAYSTYNYPDLPINGEPGWGCGIGHTHIIVRSFDEPRNPWKLEPGPYSFRGEVDGDKPSGRGHMTGGGHVLAGRFTPRDWGFTLVGSMDDNRLGDFGISTVSEVDIVSWRGEEMQANALAFRGFEADGRRLGFFAQAGGAKFFGGGTNGVAVGNMVLANGDQWWGAQDIPHASDASGTSAAVQAWGQLKTRAGLYSGQLTKGKPDGCGVWDFEGGPVEVGMYIAGTYNKMNSNSVEYCRKARYVRVVDPDGFPTPATP